MAGGGVVGAGAARREGEWLRAYGRAAAMVPRVEALAAGRARLEAVNALQHESWEARDVRLQWRLLKADESRRIWEATYMASGDDDRAFLELQKSDNEDLKTFIQVLELENEELKIRMKEVECGAEHCQNATDHEHIAEDLKAALTQWKQAYEDLCSDKDKEVSALISEKDNEISALIAEKDKEVSALIAEKDILRKQVRTLEAECAYFRCYGDQQEKRATEAKQELEHLQMASQKKDDKIRKLRARAKAAEAKTRLLPEDKEVSALISEKDKEISALIPEKDKEVSALIAEKDILLKQVRTLATECAYFRCYGGQQEKRATEAKQELEQLQVASQKKDDKIRKLRARAKAVEAKTRLLPEDKEVSALISEKDKEISALIAEKDKEVSALIAEKDLMREQFRTLERDYADLRSYSSKQAAQVTEAKQELEQLQVASQKKDDEIRRLRARAKAAETKRKLVPPEGKEAQEMYCMPKEKDGEIEKRKDRQPETSQKFKKHMCETHNKNCSEGPALRQEETKKYSSKQVLAKDGQPQPVQKRKCVTFLSNDNEQNANDEETSSQVLEPLKKKREVKQDDSKAKLPNSKSYGELVRQFPVGEVEAKRNSVPEDNLQAMYCMPKETDGQIEKCKDRQPETCQKTKKVRPSCSRADFMQSQQSSSNFVQSANNLTQCTDEGGSNFQEVANAKDQLIPIVKKSIKHVCARSPLDQSSFTNVARRATHTILALSGIAHDKDRVVAIPFLFPSHCCHACDGREPAFLMGAICSSCFNSFVGDVISHIANLFS